MIYGGNSNHERVRKTKLLSDNRYLNKFYWRQKGTIQNDSQYYNM